MPTSFHSNTFLLTVFVVFSFYYGNVCLNADQPSISELDSQVSKAEDIWKAGNPREYYKKVSAIVQYIKSTSAESTQNKVTAKLFENLLEKDLNTKPDIVRADDLLLMQELASHLVFNRNTSIDGRRTNVRLLSRYLGRIRKETVPNYKPRFVTANVMPPVDGSSAIPLTAGMNPKVIADPVIRAKYEAAIRENQENNIMNTRQSVLQDAERQLSKPIVAYMIETFQTEDKKSPIVIECIKIARLTDDEKKRVESPNGKGGHSTFSPVEKGTAL